jgi:hypothetical protein
MAWPGAGKSYFYNSNKTNLLLSDSDSSVFHWICGDNQKKVNPEWPQNYIDHFRDLVRNKIDVIFCSSHKEIRRMVRQLADIKSWLILPRKEDKQFWLERYRSRGSSEDFIQNIDNHWDEWLDEIDTHNYNIVRLGPFEFINQYLVKGMLEGNPSKYFIDAKRENIRQSKMALMRLQSSHASNYSWFINEVMSCNALLKEINDGRPEAVYSGREYTVKVNNTAVEIVPTNSEIPTLKVFFSCNSSPSGDVYSGMKLQVSKFSQEELKEIVARMKEDCEMKANHYYDEIMEKIRNV